MSNIRLLFVISDLGSGGAQRVLTTMANQLVSSGYEVYLVTFAVVQSDFYSLSSNIKRKSLGVYGPSLSLGNAIFSNIKRLRLLRQEIKAISPDVVISFIAVTNIITILASFFQNVRLIISERSDPSIEHLGSPWQLLRRIFYRFASKVTANSHGVLKLMSDFVPEEKLAYLPNPVTIKSGRVDAEASRSQNILTVASLRYEKGIDILLQAFSIIKSKSMDWKLIIIGTGNAENDFRKLARELDIEPDIMWEGKQTELNRYYQMASIFVLPSRREGMPNVLLEAMSLSVPVIVSDASPGPLELVQDKYTGLVFQSENPQELADAICKLISDKELRERVSTNAFRSISDYRIEKVTHVWEEVINNC